MSKQHEKTLKNYSQANRMLVRKLNMKDIYHSKAEPDFFAKQRWNVSIEVHDSLNRNIIDISGKLGDGDMQL